MLSLDTPSPAEAVASSIYDADAEDEMVAYVARERMVPRRSDRFPDLQYESDECERMRERIRNHPEWAANRRL